MVGTWGRRLAVAFLVLILLISLGAANVAVGLDRTVLSGDHVKESLVEEEAYSVIISEAQRELAAQAGGDTTQEGPAVDELLGEVLTEEYVQEQTEANIDRIYAYLHGDRDDLYIAINTTSLKDDIAAELADQLLADLDLAEIDPTLAEMAESESQFEAVREEFKAEQLQRIQDETDQELTDAELEAIYDNRQDQIREEAIAELETRVANSDHPEEIKPNLIDIGTLRIDATLDPDMTYDEFTTALETKRGELRETVESLARDRLDEELPDTMEITEELGQSEREQLEQVREVVSIVNILAILLPLVAIGVALLIGWVARTRSGGLFVVGSTTTVTGLLSAGAFIVLQQRVVAEIETGAAQGDMSPELSGLVVGLFERTISVFQTQSWLLVALGVVLIVVGVAIRRGLVPIQDETGGDEPVLKDEAETGESVEGAEETGEVADTDEVEGAEEPAGEAETSDSEPATGDEEIAEDTDTDTTTDTDTNTTTDTDTDDDSQTQ